MSCRGRRSAVRRPRRTAAYGAAIRTLVAAVFLLVALAAATHGRVARAAEDAPSGAAAEATGGAPAEVAKTISMGDVGVESERAKRRLKESLRTLDAAVGAAAATPDLAELQARVTAQAARSAAARAADPSIDTLDRVEKDWREIRAAIGKVQTSLREHGDAIEALVRAIRETRALWTATRESALALDVSADVVRQIDEVLAAAAAAVATANAGQAEVLGLQSDVESASERVAEEVGAVIAARDLAVGQVFQRDAAPIWQRAFWQNLEPGRVGAELAAQEARDRASFTSYFARHRDRVVAHLALTLLLVAVVVANRRRIDARLAGEAELEPVRAIFRRPVALSLLVSFFAGFWVHDELIRDHAPLFGAATLIPAVIVLRQLVDRALYPVLSLAVTVFFAHQFQALVYGAEIASRVVFVLEMLALAGGSLWLQRRAATAAGAVAGTGAPAADAPGPSAAEPSRWLARVFDRGLRAVVVLASITLVAQVIGYRALAGLLGDTLVVGIYAAIVLLGVVRVLDGVVAFLLRVRPLRQLGMVRHHLDLWRRRSRRALEIAAWFLWLRLALSNLHVWDDLRRAFDRAMESQLPLPEVTLTLGSLVAAVVVFWGAMLVSRFLRFVLAEDVYTRVPMPRGRPYAISTLLHYSLLIIGLVLAVAALGFDANRATLLTGAFGVGIGFGLQTIVNNFISGVILLVERPIQVGDTVELGTVTGEVERIGIRSCTVRTWQGAEVIVPNADLIAHQVTNWTKSDRRRRVEVPVGVAYGSDPAVVVAALLEAARRTENVLESPTPQAFFMGLGDSTLNFELRLWTGDFDLFLTVRSDLLANVTACFADVGLEIAYPQRDLHLKFETAEARRIAGELAAAREPAVPTPLRTAADEPRKG